MACYGIGFTTFGVKQGAFSLMRKGWTHLEGSARQRRFSGTGAGTNVITSFRPLYTKDQQNSDDLDAA